MRPYIGVLLLLFGVSPLAFAGDFADIYRALRNASPESVQRSAERAAVREVDKIVTAEKVSSVMRDDDLPYGEDGTVIFYSIDTCPRCKQARAYFDKHSIPYRELDVNDDPVAEAEFRKLNGRGVPLLLIGKERMTGWSERNFKKLYAKATGIDPQNATNTVATGQKQAPVKATKVEEGAVLTTKISGVPLYPGPEKSEPILSHLKKGDEVVVMGKAEGGLVPVRTGLHEGWVEVLLLR